MECRSAYNGRPLSEAPETQSEEPARLLYFTLMSAIDAGLPRTMEDALQVMRHASQPLGPMETEWLEQQGQALKEESPG